jgi:hypothetical protein
VRASPATLRQTAAVAHQPFGAPEILGNRFRLAIERREDVFGFVAFLILEAIQDLLGRLTEASAYLCGGLNRRVSQIGGSRPQSIESASKVIVHATS